MNSLKSIPPVSRYILISIMVVFVLQLIFGESFTYMIALNPYGSEGFNYLQYFTACFAHGGFLHLFFNSFALWSFAPSVEKRFGSKNFLWFYITVGVLANVMWHLISDPMNPGLGASGALFGVLTVFVILFPDTKLSIIFLPFWGFKASRLLLVILAVELGLVLFSIEDNIAHVVHLSGAALGLLYYIGFIKKKKNRVVKRAGIYSNK